MKLIRCLACKETLLLGLGLSLMLSLPLLASITSASDYHGLEINREAENFPTGSEATQQFHHIAKPRFITFGYLDCSQSCPIQLATMMQLAEQAQGSAEVIWVSLQPERDRGAPNHGQLRFVYPDNNQQARQLAHRYGLQTQYQQNRELNHQDTIFLVDQYNKVRVLYQGSQISAEQMLLDLKTLQRNDQDV